LAAQNKKTINQIFLSTDTVELILDTACLMLIMKKLFIFN